MLLASLFLSIAPCSQDPSVAPTLGEAISIAQHAEIRARTEHDTTEGFQAWKLEFAVQMRSLAERWTAKSPRGEDLFALARLWVYAGEWARVDETLTTYLGGPAQQVFVARCERARARAQCGRSESAREDLIWLLEKEPQRFDLALFLYGLPALVEPAGRELGQRILARLAKRYEGDAYEPICASLAKHLQGLGQTFEAPKALGRIAQPAPEAPALRLLFFFRSSAPLTRAPLPFLKKLGERFADRGLSIEIAAPREGAAFWERFRPSAPQPSVEEELLALTAMCRALELRFPCALLAEPKELEQRYDLRVLPHFVLLDGAGRAVLFACGGEGYEWLEGAIDRALPSGAKGADRDKE